MIALKTKGSIAKLIQNKISRKKRVFMFEIPEEKYFDINTDVVKTLVNMGFNGIYISVHRPYISLVKTLKERGVKTDNLIFIDAASSATENNGINSEQCKYISKELKVDELTRAIYTSIPVLGSKKKFVFLDSLTTLTLYQPLSETMRFAEFLTRTLKKSEFQCVIVNVAKGLSQRKFIQDIVLHVDEVIEIGE